VLRGVFDTLPLCRLEFYQREHSIIRPRRLRGPHRLDQSRRSGKFSE